MDYYLDHKTGIVMILVYDESMSYLKRLADNFKASKLPVVFMGIRVVVK